MCVSLFCSISDYNLDQVYITNLFLYSNKLIKTQYYYNLDGLDMIKETVNYSLTVVMSISNETTVIL